MTKPEEMYNLLLDAGYNKQAHELVLQMHKIAELVEKSKRRKAKSISFSIEIEPNTKVTFSFEDLSLPLS